MDQSVSWGNCQMRRRLTGFYSGHVADACSPSCCISLGLVFSLFAAAQSQRLPLLNSQDCWSAAWRLFPAFRPHSCEGKGDNLSLLVEGGKVLLNLATVELRSARTAQSTVNERSSETEGRCPISVTRHFLPITCQCVTKPAKHCLLVLWWSHKIWALT